MRPESNVCSVSAKFWSKERTLEQIRSASAKSGEVVNELIEGPGAGSKETSMS